MRFGGPGFGFFGRGPRRGGGGIIFLILIIMMVGPFFGFIIPLLIGGVAIWAIYKLIAGIIDGNDNKTKTSQFTGTKVKNNNVSNADLTKIDKKLTAYFKNNVELMVADDISLVTSSGKYVSVDQLYLAYQGEKVIKLSDFKEEHYQIYNRIFDLLKEFSKKPDKEIYKKEKEPEKKTEVKRSNIQLYIDKINELNAQIPQEEITNGLHQTCDLLKKIELTKESKQDENKLKKLFDYYLPILIDILEKYKSLQNGIKDEEFNKCETQLIKTVMLINQALKTLYNEMHEDDYLNINADIDTLQTLLKKDGFDNPFSKEDK